MPPPFSWARLQFTITLQKFVLLLLHGDTELKKDSHCLQTDVIAQRGSQFNREIWRSSKRECCSALKPADPLTSCSAIWSIHTHVRLRLHLLHLIVMMQRSLRTFPPHHVSVSHTHTEERYGFVRVCVCVCVCVRVHLWRGCIQKWCHHTEAVNLLVYLDMQSLTNTNSHTFHHVLEGAVHCPLMTFYSALILRHDQCVKYPVALRGSPPVLCWSLANSGLVRRWTGSSRTSFLTDILFVLVKLFRNKSKVG